MQTMMPSPGGSHRGESADVRVRLTLALAACPARDTVVPIPTAVAAVAETGPRRLRTSPDPARLLTPNRYSAAYNHLPSPVKADTSSRAARAAALQDWERLNAKTERQLAMAVSSVTGYAIEGPLRASVPRSASDARRGESMEGAPLYLLPPPSPSPRGARVVRERSPKAPPTTINNKSSPISPGNGGGDGGTTADSALLMVSHNGYSNGYGGGALTPYRSESEGYSSACNTNSNSWGGRKRLFRAAAQPTYSSASRCRHQPHSTPQSRAKLFDSALRTGPRSPYVNYPASEATIERMNARLSGGSGDSDDDGSSAYSGYSSSVVGSAVFSPADWEEQRTLQDSEQVRRTRLMTACQLGFTELREEFHKALLKLSVSALSQSFALEMQELAQTLRAEAPKDGVSGGDADDSDEDRVSSSDASVSSTGEDFDAGYLEEANDNIGGDGGGMNSHEETASENEKTSSAV